MKFKTKYQLCKFYTFYIAFRVVEGRWVTSKEPMQSCVILLSKRRKEIGINIDSLGILQRGLMICDMF